MAHQPLIQTSKPLGDHASSRLGLNLDFGILASVFSWYACAYCFATSLFVYSEFIHVGFPRMQELKETHPFEFATFANAKKNQIFPYSFLVG